MKMNKLQIDVKSKIDDLNMVECHLWFNGRMYKVYMSSISYASLIAEGLFVRDGNSEDSAGMINTTDLYSSKA